MSATGRALPLAVTMGEPAGIGGEIALMAWHARERNRLPCFFVLDAPARLSKVARAIGIDTPIVEIDSPAAAAQHFADALPVFPIALVGPVQPGKPDPDNATSVQMAIERAVKFALDDEIAAVVTNPIHKATLYQAGFQHQGHTDYLAELCQSKQAPVMMLAAAMLRVVPVTVHLGLREAIDNLTEESIVTAGLVTDRALRRDFGCAKPRLAVAGLNPHAGEAGNLGREEIDIIAPAVETLRAQDIETIGPLAADGMFHAAARNRYDAALCMYHDQALIPLKTLDFEHGVNVTLGLDIVRTSPDHGTALALAGTGQANPSSLIAALQLAAAIATRRAEFDAA